MLNDDMAEFVVHPGAVEPYERLSLPLLAQGRSPVTAAATYYRRLAAKAGAVLEYGAGRGALTWPLASAGAKVTAVEFSAALLEELGAAGAAQPAAVRRRVTRAQADMRSLRLTRRFPLVIAPLNTVSHLYNRRDLEAFLEGVRHHLSPDGRFVFDLVFPHPDAPAGDYDPVAQVSLHEFEGGICLAERQYFPRELEMLLHYNGFSHVRLRAGFTSRRTDEAERVLLVSAQKRAVAPSARRRAATRSTQRC